MGMDRFTSVEAEMVSGRSLESWRTFFQTSDSGIIDVIENAILVAASYCPVDLSNHRDRLAQRLFSCRLCPCSDCNPFGLKAPVGREEKCVLKQMVPKEEDGDCGNDARIPLNPVVSNYSCDEVEALTEEMVVENRNFVEVMEIKEVLERNESESVLLQSLRQLQYMGISYQTLETTAIGKSVNRIRKHNSIQVRAAVKTLIQKWKAMVDQWVEANDSIVKQEATPESMNPSSIDEEGLPFPPPDEEALMETQTTTIEFSEFFNGLDDDGNPQNCDEYKNKQENRQTKSLNEDGKRKMKQTQIPIPNSGPGRPQHCHNDCKVVEDFAPVVRQSNAPRSTKSHDKSNMLDDDDVKAKMEITKRRLSEHYQQLDNAKKQKTIRVMELHDLPKQGTTVQRQPVRSKPGNLNKKFKALGRR